MISDPQVWPLCMEEANLDAEILDIACPPPTWVYKGRIIITERGYDVFASFILVKTIINLRSGQNINAVTS
jgi:hypothetical protein